MSLFFSLYGFKPDDDSPHKSTKGVLHTRTFSISVQRCSHLLACRFFFPGVSKHAPVKRSYSYRLARKRVGCIVYTLDLCDLEYGSWNLGALEMNFIKNFNTVVIESNTELIYFVTLSVSDKGAQIIRERVLCEFLGATDRIRRQWNLLVDCRVPERVAPCACQVLFTRETLDPRLARRKGGLVIFPSFNRTRRRPF